MQCNSVWISWISCRVCREPIALPFPSLSHVIYTWKSQDCQWMHRPCMGKVFGCAEARMPVARDCVRTSLVTVSVRSRFHLRSVLTRRARRELTDVNRVKSVSSLSYLYLSIYNLYIYIYLNLPMAHGQRALKQEVLLLTM